jgi:amino acid adenylation domain-containing protein/thioester reductase-like protein
VATVTKPEKTASDDFVVVLNEEGQHALWQAELDVPSGWRRGSPVMSASECLAAIDDSWPDVTPASVRAGVPPGAPGERFVHEQFAEQASRRPEAIAVIAGRARLTYRELDESASRLARYLSEAGVAPETMVGVCLERGVDMIRAILAIMKAGGGYLPLDPSLPPDRLARICAQAGPAVVITDRAAPIPDTRARHLQLRELAADLERLPATTPAIRPHPGNICYVIYTSGSTGDPKAVAVSYGALAGVIGSVAGEYQIGDDDRVAQVASPSFDTSVEQVFAALTRGATLMVPPPGTVAPSELLRGIERRRVTVIDLTPAYWHQVLAHTVPGDERLRSVRLMITGGEMADPADCDAALRAAPWARLLNAYGLTETTITSTLYDVGAGLSATSQGTGVPAARVPVGRPVGHARIMVLDEKLRPVATGTTGEIYIGGPVVARGYLGRPALTAQRFLPDAGGAPGTRMYRTGDSGRLLEDGNLEVDGRLDRQLKVHGFRVEPGEIERALAGHPDIDQVAVVAGTRGSGDTRLVAYYTPSPGAAAATAGHHPPAISLRRYLLDRLPGYMIPAAFIARQHLPTAPADGPGPEQGEQLASVAARDEPHTPAQAGLSALWARLLHREHVGLDDDFFALGGNSLLAAEMLAHTCAIFGVSADSVRPLTRSLLRDPTLRAFSATVQAARAGTLSSDGDQPEADFAREARLDLTIRRDAAPWRPRPDWHSPREILLTGATGFLGVHLLSELLAATSARIWCLVRADDEAGALERITRAAARYELSAPPADRVVPLPGDLAGQRLGLSDVAFRDLARDVDVIYHAGALVNFIYPYQELRAANVAGTREVIRLAALYRGIPVHYVSTTAVLAGLGVAGVREVTEETPLAWPERLRMGYVETKYVAEELLRNAGRAGLPVAIYRPLDIVGSMTAGVWSTATEMSALIRFITDTGLAPDIDLPLDFVPVDTCAAAIRHVSVSQEATGRTYHLASPEQAPLAALIDRLRDRGYQVSEIPFAHWVSELARQAARDPSHPMAAFLPLFIDRDTASGLTVAEMYLRHVFPAYSRSNTEQALRGSGIAFPPVKGQLLDHNIDRLMDMGYLPAPPDSRRRADAHRRADAC